MTIHTAAVMTTSRTYCYLRTACSNRSEDSNNSTWRENIRTKLGAVGVQIPEAVLSAVASIAAQLDVDNWPYIQDLLLCIDQVSPYMGCSPTL